MIYKYLLGFGIALLLTFCQCNGCRESPCTEGYEEQGDQCKCPSEKFETQKICRELKPNEYFGNASNCACEDSSFFEIGSKVYNALTNQTTIDITQLVYSNANINNVVFRKYSFEYIKLLSGKEILFGTNIILGPCYTTPGADVRYNRGEILSPDSIRLLFIEERGFGSNLTIDTCIWNLHK